MAQTLDKLVVRFESQNAEKVKAELKKLGIQFEKTSTKGKKGFNRLRVETEGLRRNIGQVRNNLLLVAFATEAARRAFSGFLKAAGQLEQFEARLRSMTGSAKVAENQMKLFMKTAAETPFTVEQVVQGAVQLQAFGASAEALIEPMANLAAFMGRSVPEAANAFGRAFAGGRGAADVFRETGILTIIDSFESLDEGLNKTGLNLFEFRVKMVEALADPDGKISRGIAELEGTLFQTFSNMQDAVFVFQARVGDQLAPTFINIAKKVTSFLNSFDDASIRRFISTIKVLAAGALGKLTQIIIAQIGALSALTLSYRMAHGSAAAFTIAVKGSMAALSKNFWIILAIVGSSFIEWQNNAKTAAEELKEAVAEGTITFEEYLQSLRDIMKEKALEEENLDAAENIVLLEKRLKTLQATTEVQKEQAKHIRKLKPEEIKILEAIEDTNKALKEQEEIRRSLEKFGKDFNREEAEYRARSIADIVAGNRLKETLDKDQFKNKALRIEVLAALTKGALDQELINQNEAQVLAGANFIKNAKERLKEIQEIIDGFSESNLTAAAEDLQAKLDFNNTLKWNYFDMFSDIANAFSSMIDGNLSYELKGLRKSDKFRNASMEKRQDMERDLEDRFRSQRMLAFRMEQVLQITSLVMKLAETKATIDLLANAAAMAGDMTAKGRAAAFKKMATMSVGVQSAMIASQKPAFARGGSFITDGPQHILVGDNPGGAERVDISPLSSPNFDGPQGSEISINIMGNVIGTEEFVRETLIPELNNSLRRNLA